MTNLDINSLQSKSLSEDSISEGNQQESNEVPKFSKACTKFEYCSANLCPANPNILFNGSWFPDEEICTAHAFISLPWIKQQRKIARKVRNRDFCFTYEMLSHNCVITVATEGIDPDNEYSDIEAQVNHWKIKHPEKKEMSVERKEFIRNMGNSLRQGSTPFGKEQSVKETEGFGGKPTREISLTLSGSSIVPSEITSD